MVWPSLPCAPLLRRTSLKAPYRTSLSQSASKRLRFTVNKLRYFILPFSFIFALQFASYPLTNPYYTFGKFSRLSLKELTKLQQVKIDSHLRWHVSPFSFDVLVTFPLFYPQICRHILPGNGFYEYYGEIRRPSAHCETSLLRLGLKPSFSFRGRRPKTDGLSSGKIDCFLCSPTLITRLVYGKVSGFVVCGQLTH